MINAPALQEFAEEQRREGYSHFVFDFQRCIGLDSTFMGVMVGLQSCAESESSESSESQFGALSDDPESAARQQNSAGELEPLSPAEALAELSKACEGGSRSAANSDAEPRACTVSAVNISKELRALLAMLGVDKFINISGQCDLSRLEATPLPEKQLSPDERHRLIFKAHETLVEIDKRNEAQFGPLLQSLSQALNSSKA
jgi:anti-anti-sigma regulatory factor